MRPLGNPEILVDGIAEPSQASPTDLALAMYPSYSDCLKSGRAVAALVWSDADINELGLQACIPVAMPRYALAKVSALFAQEKPVPSIHALASVDPSATIGENVSIGAFSYIGEGASIGSGSVIGPNCTIGANACIGPDATIAAGVRIGRNIIIGSRFIAHENAVIGSDGFSFAAAESGAVEQVRANLHGEVTARQTRQCKIHSLGTVRIGDDVEIGAGTAIDRGTVSATEIGDGTKIDNQVHIAHNVKVGRDCLICGLVGIAGSADIGDRVVLAGMSGVSDHVQIGDDVVAAGSAKIYTRVKPGTAVMGSPATEMDKNIGLLKLIRRLPRLFRRVSKVENQVLKLSKTE